MKPVEIYFEQNKYVLESNQTPKTIMEFFKLSPERFTLYQKTKDGYHEFLNDNESIELTTHSNFGVFDKRPTYNA